MRAIVYEAYGPPDVLRLKELKTPSPKKHEVLIKTHAATVSSADWRLRSLSVPAGFGWIMRLAFGLTRPRNPILGSELAGVVEAVGEDVDAFRVGDAVFAFSDTALGCHAEYKCMPQTAAVLHKPPNLDFAEAAALSFGGTTALDFLRKGGLRSGERILINGASGAVGTAMVQLAKHLGAEVVGVCSTANVDLVASLGASHVIDYTQEDFTRNGETYDVIVDVVGTAPFSRCRASLKGRGRLLLVSAGLLEMLHAPWASMTSGKKVIAGPVTVRVDDLRMLAELARKGLFKPVVDRCFPFECFADAHRYVDTGRKRGNVVLMLERDVDPHPSVEPAQPSHPR